MNLKKKPAKIYDIFGNYVYGEVWESDYPPVNYDDYDDNNYSNFSCMDKKAPQKIVTFQCGWCGKPYETEDAAVICADRDEANDVESNKRKAELEIKKDYIRTNVEKISEIPELLRKCCTEWWGIQFPLGIRDIRFDPLLANSQRCPIAGMRNDTWQPGKGRDATKGPLGYPGYTALLHGSYGKKEKPNKQYDQDFGSWFASHHPSINDILSFFKCIHHETRMSGGNEFEISLYLFVDDFPNLKTKYADVERLKTQWQGFNKQLVDLRASLKVEIHDYPYCVEQREKVAFLKRQANDLEVKWKVYHGNKVNELFDERKPKPDFDLQAWPKLAADLELTAQPQVEE